MRNLDYFTCQYAIRNRGSSAIPKEGNRKGKRLYLDLSGRSGTYHSTYGAMRLSNFDIIKLHQKNGPYLMTCFKEKNYYFRPGRFF